MNKFLNKNLIKYFARKTSVKNNKIIKLDRMKMSPH